MDTLTTIQPAYSDIMAMIDSRTNLQPTTKAQYKKAIRNYLYDYDPESKGYVPSGRDLGDVGALTQYAIGLKKSSRSFLKSAIRLWGDGVALRAKGSATPDNVNAVQATVYRIEALNEAIQVEASEGDSFHIWLSQNEVKRLMGTCNVKTIQGKRDRVILGLLVGAGLRREEAVTLTFDDIVIQPIEGKFRTVLNVKGKGAKKRPIPISDRLATILDEWRDVVGGGLIARSVTRGDAIGDSLSAVGAFEIVGKAGAAIGKPELAAHDLRRTFAQLGFEAGVSIIQLSKLLGHSSIAVTERYLKHDLDLKVTASDFIPL